MEHLKVGDKVYPKGFHKSASATVLSVVENRNGDAEHDYISVRFDKPIELLSGVSTAFVKI